MSAVTVPSGTDDSIRLPPDVDPLVGKGVTAAALKATIAQVSAECGPLYDRKWRKTSTGQPGFTVLQYNILAEGLSVCPTATPPFDAARRDTRFYGGFDSVPNPEKVFDFSKRRFRLLEDILRYDPTIITLEECDHFPDFFEPALRKFGYEGVFQPKSDAPGCESGFYSDGVGVLWKADQFRLDGGADLGSHIGGTGPDPVKVVHAVVPLLPVAPAAGPAQRLIVVCTHLKAKANVANEARRAGQITALLGLVQTVRKEGDAVLVAADFNADPFPVQDGGETVEPNTVKATLRSGLSLTSAYALPASSEDPAYTTWKSRKGVETRHVIDYIFHTSQLKCTDVLGPPAAADLEPTRLPGMRAPSDHLPIAAKFAIVPGGRVPPVLLTHAI